MSHVCFLVSEELVDQLQKGGVVSIPHLCIGRGDLREQLTNFPTMRVGVEGKRERYPVNILNIADEDQAGLYATVSVKRSEESVIRYSP